MARKKPQYTPAPRILDTFQVATLLGMSESAFRNRRCGLEALGFPHRDVFFGGWDAEAIEIWLDIRAGIGRHVENDAVWMETLNGAD